MTAELTLVTGTRLWTQARNVFFHTTLEKDTSAAAEDVAYNVATLRITAHYELGVRTSLVVGRDLFLSINNTLGDRFTKWRWERVVEVNVLVIAALQSRADGLHQLSLSPRLRLIVALGEKDVHVLAISVADAN